MSHMPNSYENADVNMYQEPERTSVMAIMSLVLGVLGCCTLVTAPFGLVLGVFGLIGISRSNGRVGGNGLAIGGIVISILSMALWAGIVFGIGGAMKMGIAQFGATTESVLTDIQSSDYDSARAQMIPPASEVSDAELAAFYAAYQADLGNFVSMPSGLGDLFSGYGSVGPLIQNYNGRTGYVPMPVRFDSGWVLVIYVMDTSGQGGGSGQIPPPMRLILVGQDGREYTIPADSGDRESENRPDGQAPSADLPGDSAEDQTSDGENADETGEDGPEGP